MAVEVVGVGIVAIDVIDEVAAFPNGASVSLYVWLVHATTGRCDRQTD